MKKTDEGVSWGSVHWQYLEDICKVTPHEGTPLKLEKRLFKRTYTKAGPIIDAVKDGEPIGVGDELVVRIVLRTDRDMEYVHLKDHRGSGTEPVNVLSQYKYQDGLALLREHQRHRQPLLHRLPAEGDVRLRVRRPRAAQGQVPDRLREHPVHVRPGVQQPLGEHQSGSEVERAASVMTRSDEQISEHPATAVAGCSSLSVVVATACQRLPRPPSISAGRPGRPPDKSASSGTYT